MKQLAIDFLYLDLNTCERCMATDETLKQAIEVLSSVLENWVHDGDADCIIAEFEEKLNNK